MINHSKICDCFIYWMLLTVPLILKYKEYYLGYAMQIILVTARISDLIFSTVPVLETEKAMATHSTVLAWRIPGMGEPGGLPSKGLHRVGHD